MKYIVIDLEMNPIKKAFKAERVVSKNEIIEIGAVVLDESLQEIGSFKTYVKPEYNDIIERNITRLTGITTDMVSEAPSFERALHMFVNWCESMHEDYQIFAWSESDLKQLLNESKLKQYKLTQSEQYMFHNWFDFQEEYGEVLGLERQISLKNALMYAGLDFKGRQHDALFDARNTAELFSIVRDDNKKNAALTVVLETLQEKPLANTIGDMFDFSQFYGQIA